MLIIMCLLPLIVLTFLSVIFGNNFIDITLDTGWSDKTSLFKIHPITGMIVIILAIAVFTVLIGIQVIATGLSETSIKAISTGLLYTGLWTILSFLSAPLIKGIEIFGTLIYIGLTIGYVIGVIEKMYGSV